MGTVFQAIFYAVYLNRLNLKSLYFRWYYRRGMFLSRTDKEMDRIKIRKRNGRNFGFIRSGTKAAYFNTRNGFTSSRSIVRRIPTVKLKIPGKAFLISETRTSVTFKLTLFIFFTFYHDSGLAKSQPLPLVDS